MPAPIPDRPMCDVPGCGALADISTTGEEVDHLGRKALARINVCAHHSNWPHSEDAVHFASLKSKSRGA